MKDLESFLCPQRHTIPFTRDSFAKDFSEEVRDADGLPMYEVGLYCYECQRPYGISKLKENNPS